MHAIVCSGALQNTLSKIRTSFWELYGSNTWSANRSLLAPFVQESCDAEFRISTKKLIPVCWSPLKTSGTFTWIGRTVGLCILRLEKETEGVKHIILKKSPRNSRTVSDIPPNSRNTSKSSWSYQGDAIPITPCGSPVNATHEHQQTQRNSARWLVRSDAISIVDLVASPIHKSAPGKPRSRVVARPIRSFPSISIAIFPGVIALVNLSLSHLKVKR